VYSSPKYYSSDQIKEGELGGAWHIGGRREVLLWRPDG